MKKVQEFLQRADTIQEIGALQETVTETIFTWPAFTRRDRLKRGIKRYLLFQDVPPVDPYFWPNALLAEGLAEKGKADADGKGMDVLRRYYDRWLKSGISIYYLDNAAHGMPLLDLYGYTKEQGYLDGADRLARYLMGHPRDPHGSLPYRTRKKSHIYADSLGMICPFLCRYGELTEDKAMVGAGVSQLVLFLKGGMDPATGLPYHGFDSGTGEKCGCIGWGRAAGWLLTGLSGSLAWLPEGISEACFLRDCFRAIVKEVLCCQREDGSFAWLLPAREGPADTSSTAMIACSLLMGMQRGILDGDVEERICRAGGFLLSCMKGGNVTQCSGECGGFGEYPQRYGSYPWSNGPTLRLFGLMEGACGEHGE